RLKDEVAFRDWLATRTILFPGTPQRVFDTVWRREEADGSPWAFPVESQTQPHPDTCSRVTAYLGMIALEVRPGKVTATVAPHSARLTPAYRTPRVSLPSVSTGSSRPGPSASFTFSNTCSVAPFLTSAFTFTSPSATFSTPSSGSAAKRSVRSYVPARATSISQ